MLALRWRWARPEPPPPHVPLFAPPPSPPLLLPLVQINGSLARKAIQILLEKKLIKPITTHASQSIYTRNTAA